MKLLFAAIGALVGATGPAHAEFSDEWNALAEEIEAGCDAMESTLASGGVTPAPAKPLYLPDRLRGPFRPHMCVIVEFSIDASGAPQNVESIYRGPENLNYQFVRRTQGAVKKWRFDLEGTSPAEFSRLYARMDFIPLGGWRYSIRYNYWNSGETGAGGE
ncbi:MAG: hypothetical protein KDD85_11660 [Parvularculaceae bacterium]|nr:hypothetical protein [Parvularculaceae bacterium]